MTDLRSRELSPQPLDLGARLAEMRLAEEHHTFMSAQLAQLGAVFWILIQADGNHTSVGMGTCGPAAGCSGATRVLVPS